MTSTNLTLADLGWGPFFSAQLSADEAGYHPVRVMAVHRGKVVVAGAGLDLVIDPHVPGAGAQGDHPTVGDWLLLDDMLLPVRVLDRANLFKRRAPGHGRRQQLIAANIDTLFIVAACNQDFSVARLERYLVLAREVGVHPVIILTKMDLAETPDSFAAAARRLQPGLLVETVNARDPASVARLAVWCGSGRTVALLGSSGVGKSTLVNTLRGTDTLATQPVREADGTGQHTTTVREMHRLDQGGWLLDTPGMRELQLADAATGIAELFDDIVALVQACRFSNCAHRTEPHCAVQAAIADGRLDPTRYDRWRRLGIEDGVNSAQLAGRRGR